MKKLLTLLLSLLAAIGTLSARPVDPQTAASVARNFYTYIQPSAAVGSVQMALAYQSKGKLMNDLDASITYFYVFNDAANKGYVIVSGDDRAMPVLAYSTESNFDPSVLEHQTNTAKWFEMYKAEIRDLIEKNAPDAVSPAQDWLKWQRSDNPKALGTRGVSPLVTTRWSQSPYENALCPYDYTVNKRAVSGCVATAMAQIMKFWNYPTRGTGYSSYQHPNYGTLSANFGTTTYGWSSMPNNLTSANSAVATLMYHCGVGVNMTYSPTSSGAWVISANTRSTNCAEYALKTYFNYVPTLRGIARANYSSQWESLLRTELDARRPVLYDGFGGGSGHAFVCDGYDNNGFFHFNWGWGGSYDDYFLTTALSPTGTGTGGGSGSYNSGQEIIIGIQPASGGGGGGTTPPNIQLYSDIVVNPDPIAYGDPFTVKFNLINKGTTTFNGVMTAALFDEDDNFVDFVGELSTITGGLPANYTFRDGLTFTKSDLDASPGFYTLCAFVKPTGGEWTLVGDGNYGNCIEIEIEGDNSDGMQLYAPITTTPSVITLGSPFTGKFNVINRGTSPFTGKYSLDLHNLDGTHLKELSYWNATNSLSVNNYYSSNLTTNPITLTAADVAPGTYFIAAWAQRTGGDWQLLEPNTFKNPIRVVISSPPLQGDIYEPNNTATAAYSFAASYNSSNIAKIVTNNANLHLASDNDYFKVALPAGYRYTIKARVHDKDNSGDGVTYSSDVLLSYSTGGAYSEPYDVSPANDFIVQGATGKTITFWVAPYFAGLTGTYKLDVQITRVVSSDVEDLTEKLGLKVAPNPVNEALNVLLDAPTMDVQSVQVFDMLGRQKWVSTVSNAPFSAMTIPTLDFAEGVYVLKINTSKGFAKQKFVVRH